MLLHFAIDPMPFDKDRIQPASATKKSRRGLPRRYFSKMVRLMGLEPIRLVDTTPSK